MERLKIVDPTQGQEDLLTEKLTNLQTEGRKAYLKVCQSSKRTWPWFGMVNSKDRRSVKKKFIRYEETVTPEWDKMYETQLGRN